MKYYLIPKEEQDLDIISEKWCIGRELENNQFSKGIAWKIYEELKNKSNKKINLLNFYRVKNQFGKVISWIEFKKILNKKKIIK